jgi:hypothetical protein
MLLPDAASEKGLAHPSLQRLKLPGEVFLRSG